MHELEDYLRCNVPSDKLLSVSIFEDEHPNDGSGINAVIVFKPGLLFQSTEFQLDLLLKVGENWSWNDVFAQAVRMMNNKGVDKNFIVSTANRTIALPDGEYDSGAIVLIITLPEGYD